MFETLKRLYRNGAIDTQALQSAVQKHWITLEQAREITNN